MKIAGWGRYPWVESEGRHFETQKQLPGVLSRLQDCIVYACGRSYGDSALNERVILTRRFDKILAFDDVEGVVTCESGVTLAELTEAFLPRGWFLCVTPGTRYVSVGGAIASDVHGKNHHKTGCFSECLLSLTLMLPQGEVVHCSENENVDLFRATCGGMGLTGVILEGTLRLQPVRSAYIRETVIRCRNLEEVFSRFEEYGDATYSVAWIDCLARCDRQGRSILMLGEHAEIGRLDLDRERQISLPFNSPAFLLNRYSVRLFNELYFQRQPEFVDGRLVPMDQFFYPLDKISHWNRIYGKKGFTQYQVVVPKEAARDALKEVLYRTSDIGLGSFLAVLKLLGSENENYLSFPFKGYTITLDFRIQRHLFPLLDELDRIILDYGGRIYLAKDARMSRQTFRRSYANWTAFAELREKHGMNMKFSSLQSRRLGV